MANDKTTEAAPGANRDFSFTLSTKAPDEPWRLWATASTSEVCDKGRQAAPAAGEMGLGSTGRIQPLPGPATRFEFVSFDPQGAYALVMKLPMADVKVERSFNADQTTFTHRVTFSGPLAFAFAGMFGPGFRHAAPPALRQLNAVAEAA